MPSDPRLRTLPEAKTVELFDIVIDLERPLNFGAGPVGRRVLFGLAGGTFEGPQLRGDVLPGGGDWTLVRPDGTATLDVRLTLRTHDSALIYMSYAGRWKSPPELAKALADPGTRHEVDPQDYYLRTNPLFETGDPRYAWLNDVVGVGTGYLVQGGVAYKVCRVL